MKKIITIYLLLITGLPVFAQGIPDPLNEQAGTLGFVQNVGQVINTDDNQMTGINYHSLHATPKSYFSNSNINFVYAKFAKDTINNDTLARLDMTWIADGYGNTTTPTIFETTDEKVNYYLAHCNNGCDQLSVSKGLLYENIYENIDLRMYSNNVGYKIYFVVRPGGNPQHIRMFFEGQTSLNVTLDYLTVNIGGNSFSLPGGIAYEYDAVSTDMLPWTPQFNLNTNGTVEVAGGAYNTNKTLVYELSGLAKGGLDMKNIDWSVHFGGEGDDEFYDVDVNNNNEANAAGYTYSKKIPTATGMSIFQGTNKGNADILLVKFKNDLSLAWSTYYGGSSDDGHKGKNEKYGISLDNNNNIFIAAPTRSTTDIKRMHITGAYKDEVNNSGGTILEPATDLIIARFNAAGQLNWATFFGGKDNTVFPHFNGDIIVDKTTNEIYVTGVDAEVLPVDPGIPAYMKFKNSSTDEGAYITKFNANLQQVWCTYFGSSGEANKVSSLDIDSEGRLLATGSTPEFGGIPRVATTGYYTQNYGGGQNDQFITRFNTNLSPNWSTYIGGVDYDKGNTVIATKNNKIIVLGNTLFMTNNTAFPNYKTSVTNVFNQNIFGGETARTFGDATVCTFDFNGKEENFTYLGGSAGEEDCYAACASNGGNVYLSGSTNSNNFPVPPIANNATNNFYVGSTKNQAIPNDHKGLDLFIMGLTKDFVPAWSTFYGGTGFDNFWANVTYNNYVYFVGGSSSVDFPTTSSGNAYPGSTPTSGMDAIISRANMGSSTLNVNSINTKSNHISIYPNPASNKLNITSNTFIKNILVYDITGKFVKQINTENQQTKTCELEIAEMGQGIYLIEIVDKLGAKVTAKFIKE
jgi:hypothetical protein